jgi:hypothetical protein
MEGRMRGLGSPHAKESPELKRTLEDLCNTGGVRGLGDVHAL